MLLGSNPIRVTFSLFSNNNLSQTAPETGTEQRHTGFVEPGRIGGGLDVLQDVMNRIYTHAILNTNFRDAAATLLKRKR
ncbi:hypothetical protein E4U49_000882 [Claviceps purpurea]|nr:hypothetical protein E4U49_000882 [Claviceps purpurea]